MAGDEWLRSAVEQQGRSHVEQRMRLDNIEGLLERQTSLLDQISQRLASMPAAAATSDLLPGIVRWLAGAVVVASLGSKGLDLLIPWLSRHL